MPMVLTKKLEKFIIDQIISNQKKDLDHSVLDLPKQMKLTWRQWDIISNASYLSVLTGVFNRIQETQVSSVQLGCDDIFRLYDNTINEKDKKIINQFSEKLFNTPQIFEIVFHAESGASATLCKEIAPFLIKSTTVQSLAVNFNSGHMSGNELNTLVDALMLNKSCIHLSLWGNSLMDTDIPSLLKLLNKNQLQSLNLEASNFTDEGLRQIIKGVKENKSLRLLNIGEDNDFECNAILTKETMVALNELRKVNRKLKVIVNDQYSESNKRAVIDLTDSSDDSKNEMDSKNAEENLAPSAKKGKGSAEPFILAESKFIFDPSQGASSSPTSTASTIKAPDSLAATLKSSAAINKTKSVSVSTNPSGFHFNPPSSPATASSSSEVQKQLDVFMGFESTFVRKR